MYVRTIYWQDFTLDIGTCIFCVAVYFYPILLSTEPKQ